MGKMKMASAAVVVATILMLILLYFVMDFVTRTPRSESPPQAAVEELVDAADVTSVADSATNAVQQNPVADEPSVDVPAIAGTKVLRVVLEGITEEDAPMTTVTLTGVDRRDKWPAEIQDTWPWQGLTNAGLTSEFDLDPFFASVAERDDLRVDELEIEVDHPLRFLEKARVPLSRGVELKSGQTVYEVRVRLVPPVFWPEFTLTVRDAQTRAHLEDVELHIRSTGSMGVWRLPGTGWPFTLLGGGLSSPIVLLGGREADEPENRVAGLALRPAAGEAPQPAELHSAGRARPQRGIMMYAGAPGYAWGTIVLDVSTGGERELLLGPAGALGVRFANVQLKRYATLEKEATVFVYRQDPSGGWNQVWHHRLDETLEIDGLPLEPGEYAVSVELGQEYSRGKRPVLAREELSLAAGETRELVLALADPPAPSERATLGGVVSFPAVGGPNFDGAEEVRLQLYGASTRKYDVVLSLAELERVGGALPTWSFRVEDVPVGLYQFRLWPFQTSWMIELPAGGREDVELVIPELAEVRVEIVDVRTGERIPIDEIRYRSQERLPGQLKNDWLRVAFEGEPGRFHFWTAPGAGSVATFESSIGLDYDWRRQDLELVPGFQSVRFEFAPVCAFRYEFRDGEAALPYEDGIYYEVLKGIVRAVDHEGRASPLNKGYVTVSAPGVYELNFEGVSDDRFHPIPTRRVDVREGETTVVIVQLRRK